MTNFQPQDCNKLAISFHETAGALWPDNKLRFFYNTEVDDLSLFGVRAWKRAKFGSESTQLQSDQGGGVPKAR